MEDKDHLHALVHSMKKAEQSYFKKIKSAFGIVNSSLLQIFKAIQNQEEYNEEDLLKNLNKDSFREFFAVKKHSLYIEILDVLVYSKSRATEAQWQINKMISHAMILKERMLFEDAYKILQKAKKICQENEFFHRENEINQHFIEILNQSKSMTDFGFSESVESLRMSIIQTSEKSINAEQYFILSDQLYRKGEKLRLTDNDSIKIEMRNLYASPLLSSEHKAFSKTALVCYHFILYFKASNYEIDIESACYHMKKLIDLQESIKRFSPRARAVQMGNYITLTSKNNKNKEAWEMLSKMEKLNDEQKDEFILSSYLAHKGFCVSNDSDLKTFDAYVDELEKVHQKTIEQLAFSKEIMDIKHILLCYYFRKGNFKKAYSIASYLDLQFDLHSFKNMKLSEKILKLLCAIELNDYDLIQAEIRAVKYMLKNIDNQLEIEIHIFETLEKISKSNNIENKNSILSQYLQTHSKTHSPDKYSFLINGFGFNEWVEAKINNKEFTSLQFKIY